MRFRPSNQYDSEYIGANMRKVDVKEFREQGINMHPTAVLEDGRAYSDLAWTIIADNTPIAMFGVVPMWQESVRWKKSIGSIWLLGTDDVETFSKDFIRASKHWLQRVSKNYDLVGNNVHMSNSVHLRWLEWLGFDFHIQTAIFGEPPKGFVLATRKKDV